MTEAKGMPPLVVTYTISIDAAGNVYNDVQPFGTFAEVYKAFHAIRDEIDRQIAERRNCPANPKTTAPAALVADIVGPSDAYYVEDPHRPHRPILVVDGQPVQP